MASYIHILSTEDHTSALYGPVCILISAIAAITVATITIKSNRHTFKQNNSLTFQQALQSDDDYKKALTNVRKAIDNRLDKPIVFYANSENVETDTDKRILKDIRYVLNVWEQAASSCVHDLYDEFHLYQSHKSMVLELGIQFRGFISEVQIERDNPDFYYNFTMLVLQWTIRRDDFVSAQRKVELKKIYKQLQTVKVGKLPKKRHKLKSYR